MLYSSESQPDLYVQQLICRFRERLNVPAFREAWRRMVERYAIFRISMEGSFPGKWRVHEAVQLPLNEFEWPGCGNFEDKLETWLAKDRHRGVDPRQAPLSRLSLYRVAADDYCFVWTSHHAILDGRSRWLVLQELFAFYEAAREGRKLELPEPPRFMDYLQWLDSRDTRAAGEFWRNRLAGVEAAAPLDWGFAEPLQDQETYGISRRRLGAPLTAALRKLGQKYDVTLNTLLQGAWALLLSHYCRRNEVVFGATRACRSADFPAAASIVGLLINTVPVRAKVTGGEPLGKWLKMLRKQWVEMRPYEGTPIDQIQAWSGLAPGQPLFETLVVFERYQLNTAMRALGGSWASRSFEVRGITNFPLVISGYDEGETLFLEFVNHRNRLDDATVARLADHLEHLLSEMAATPERRLEDFLILTPKEERQIVREWNATASHYPQDSIAGIFETVVLKQPEAVAVTFGPKRLTYTELDVKATALACCLRGRGVDRNVPVGICMERSLEMIVALLGILKAGGTYVPLDPAWPGKRIAELISDANIHFAVTRGASENQLPPGLATIGMDTFAPGREPAPPRDELPRNSPDDIAYIMFTSGSTGRPKGVRIRHRGVARLVKNTQYCRFSPGEVFFQFAPLAFDASTFEIWGALLNGATLAVAPPETPSLGELARWIKERNVTTLWLTSSLFQQMADGPARWLEGVKQLLAGGDRLPSRHAEAFLAKHPGCRLINGYGPTENTTFTCCYSILPSGVSGGNIPIGTPIANTQVYLLDERMHPVPVGVPGELYIGGDGLAAGYLDEVEATRSRFTSNPFGTTPGSRLYRSGDLARYLPGGGIEFLGRCDSQVKIRGFRIEPGEIEEHLLRHPALRQAAIAVHTHPSGEKYLAAYLVGNEGENPSAGDLRAFLAQSLPAPMIPWSFTYLPELPLNANGKIDRKKLPSTDSIPSIAARSPLQDRQPQTPFEMELARIWNLLLGEGAADIRINFFNAGGSSLTAMRLLSEIQRSFGVELPMSAFLSTPTIEGMAARIEELSNGEATTFPVKRGNRPARIPISLEQEKAVRLMQKAPTAALENIIRLLRLRGPLDTEALEASFNRLIARHETLRTSFARAKDGSYYQVISEQSEIRIPVTRLDSAPEVEWEPSVCAQAHKEVQTPFPLDAPPLLRLRLFRLGREDHVLLFAISHMVCDGWSLRILFSELAALYSAQVQNQEPTLSPLPVQFADFAIWERSQLCKQTLGVLENFWRRRLSGQHTPLVLALAKPRPAAPTFLARVVLAHLPAQKAMHFRELARNEEISPFMFFCAIFAMLLQKESGRGDIIIDIPFARRTQPQIQQTVGWFAKTSPICLDLTCGPTFRQLLGQVKQALLETMVHGLYPSWKLQRLAGGSPGINLVSQFDLVEVPDASPGGAFHHVKTDFIPLETVNTDWDLRIQLEWEQTGGLTLRFHYRPDLFEPTAAKIMHGRFLALAEKALHSPGSLISALEAEL